MTNQEMLNDMINLQKVYDSAVYKEFGCDFDEEKCKLAMIDEIGEFNHEIKKSWCWWKKTQKGIDLDKALEELVDVWHFALSLTYHAFDNEYKIAEYIDADSDYKLSHLYKQVIENPYLRLHALAQIGVRLGFNMEQVYEAYKKKNKINHERLANNY